MSPKLTYCRHAAKAYKTETFKHPYHAKPMRQSHLFETLRRAQVHLAVLNQGKPEISVRKKAVQQTIKICKPSSEVRRQQTHQVTLRNILIVVCRPQPTPETPEPCQCQSSVVSLLLQSNQIGASAKHGKLDFSQIIINVCVCLAMVCSTAVLSILDADPRRVTPAVLSL